MGDEPDINSNDRMKAAFNDAKTKFEKDYSLEVMKEKFPEYIRMMNRFGEKIGENGIMKLGIRKSLQR